MQKNEDVIIFNIYGMLSVGWY